MKIHHNIEAFFRKTSTVNYLAIILSILYIALGTFYIYNTWKYYDKKAYDHSIDLAEAAEAFIPVTVISQLNANENDIYKNEYQQVKKSLMIFKKSIPDIYFAYFYTVIDNKVYILTDSEPPNSHEYSPPGQEYTEAPQVFKQAYLDGTPVITEPVSDRWGTWVSALIPVKDPDTGQVIAVFGVDYPADQWGMEARKHALHAGGVVIGILLLLAAIYFILLKNRELIKVSGELKESENLFRTIFEQSPFGIAIGREYRLVSNINSKFEKILARNKEEIMELNWKDITHPEDLEEDLENYNKLKTGQIDSYSMNKRFLKPDGFYVWVNMKIARLDFSAVPEHKNQHICIIEDITEQIDAQRALLESERSKSVLLSHLPGLAYRCSYDPEWTMEYLSDGCLDLTGYKPESLLHNKFLSYNQIIAPEYRQILWDEWERVLNLHLPFKYEYEIITAMGERKWVLEMGQGLYDEDGYVEALEGIIIDITEQKLKEARIQYMSDHDFLTGLYNRKYFEDEKTRLEEDENCMPLSVFITNINGLRLINDAFGHIEGDKIIKEAAKLLRECCRQSDILARTGGDEFSIFMPQTDYNEAYTILQKMMRTIEIFNNENINKQTFEISMAIGFSTKETINYSIDKAVKEAENYMYNRKLLNRRSSHSSILSSIMTTMFAKSQETEEHARRIAKLAITAGESLGLSQKNLDELQLLSMLHDIGKVGIDDRILNKPGNLTEEEWSIMKKHPEIGYRIAMASTELETIAEYILTHHERWDGSGYPNGLKREEIPLLSRILALADAYDAMTEDRIYRTALTREEAIEEIRRNIGTQFDPYIAKTFIEILAEDQ